ncbi:TetR family transcriptional regulator [Sporosarcina sp. ACRSM]|uniref:TetR family transcriptional regulator n=1 Tax=Sporosarcina sp. ACRSM TaxID=2918216 RepID=UPI001EF5D497|nr:TetR family transcriptional regulator [Sporosarcina sp. ACRSM]
MPKQTFFNLPQDKQDTLIDSAVKEFSRVPLNEASISNIVKHAGIARGSFYQYFEDKDDLFFFILEKYAKQNEERFISLLKENDGDLFDSFKGMFRGMLTDFQNQDYGMFIKNAFLNMNHKVENTIAKNVNMEDACRQIEHHDLINRDKLNITDEQELFHVIRIILAVTFQNLIQNFALELSFEESFQNYTIEIDMIKKGLAKE